MNPSHRHNISGFTLVELSIVLVIIGLIVGGVLVGQDLIKASAVRAQVSQIEQFNTAANTFRTKYNYLPGDMPEPSATQFGFISRGANAGQGDGNGIIEGIWSSSAGSNEGYRQSAGETVAFWIDLSTAKLISGSFTYSSPFGGLPSVTASSSPNLDQWLPKAKIEQGNYIYVWSTNGLNYYSISVVSSISSGSTVVGRTGLSAWQANSIDSKTDDGLPQSGSITAIYVDNSTFSGSPWLYYGWAGTGGVQGNTSYTTSTASSSTTCFDNSSSSGAAQKYSISQGSNLNCALSFKLQ